MKQGLYYLKFSVLLFVIMTIALLSIDAFALKSKAILKVNEIVVAVIDTGVDLKHPSLKDSIWINKGEWGLDSQGKDRATNNIDDDKNGFVDDSHGWNFCQKSNQLKDTNGHGTHVAGIINNQVNKNIVLPRGLQSIKPKLKLMIIKYHDSVPCKNGVLFNTVEAIKYATKMGAHIINYSSGGKSQYFEERQAIQKAGQKGILFVAAAGNEGRNIDQSGYYPASYKLPNIISVASIDKQFRLSGFSNFGKSSVDVVAKGDRVYSALPNGQFGYLSGTSQATAVISGQVAKDLIQKPKESAIRLGLAHIKKSQSNMAELDERNIQSLDKPQGELQQESLKKSAHDVNT